MLFRGIIQFKNNWQLWNKCQRKFILQAILMLHLTPIAMRICGIQHWLTILHFLTPMKRQSIAATSTELKQIHWLNIQAVNHSLIRGKCLSRSINLWWLMRRHHIDTELCIGVLSKRNKFRAHAWLEYQGKPINADQKIGQRFRTFRQLTLNKGLQNL